MTTEEGVVIRVSGASTWLKTTRTASCNHCTSKDTCKTLGGGGADIEVEVINPIGARPGDRVMVSLPTGSLLKATFLIYMVPVICLMIGIGIGIKLSQTFFPSMDQSLLSFLTGIGAFAIALFFVRVQGTRMGSQDKYKPTIIRVVKDKPATCPNQNPESGND